MEDGILSKPWSEEKYIYTCCTKSDNMHFFWPLVNYNQMFHPNQHISSIVLYDAIRTTQVIVWQESEHTNKSLCNPPLTQVYNTW